MRAGGAEKGRHDVLAVLHTEAVAVAGAAVIGQANLLEEAKEKVEGAPTVIKASVAKAEAEEIRDKLQELGATIALE